MSTSQLGVDYINLAHIRWAIWATMWNFRLWMEWLYMKSPLLIHINWICMNLTKHVGHVVLIKDCFDKK